MNLTFGGFLENINTAISFFLPILFTLNIAGFISII
jgi:hypothetical protein